MTNRPATSPWGDTAMFHVRSGDPYEIGSMVVDSDAIGHTVFIGSTRDGMSRMMSDLAAQTGERRVAAKGE